MPIPATLTLLRGDGSHAAWDAMIAACADADAVLIGECHGMAVGQAFQAKFFRDLIAKAPEAAGALSSSSVMSRLLWTTTSPD